MFKKAGKWFNESTHLKWSILFNFIENSLQAVNDCNFNPLFCYFFINPLVPEFFFS